MATRASRIWFFFDDDGNVISQAVDLTVDPVAVVVVAVTPALTITLTPAPASATVVVADPSLTAILAPDPVAVVVAVPVPSLTVTLAPAPTAVPVVVADPALTVVLTPDPGQVSAVVADPSLTAIVAPASVVVSVTVPEPALALDLNPDPVPVTVVLPDVDLDVIPAGTAVPDPVVVVLVTPNPTLNLDLSPDPVVVTVVPVDPTLTFPTEAPPTVVVVGGVPRVPPRAPWRRRRRGLRVIPRPIRCEARATGQLLVAASVAGDIGAVARMHARLVVGAALAGTDRQAAATLPAVTTEHDYAVAARLMGGRAEIRLKVAVVGSARAAVRAHVADTIMTGEDAEVLALLGLPSTPEAELLVGAR